MPHGPLTPLGRQLRTVLVALRPVSHEHYHLTTALGRASASDTGLAGRGRGHGGAPWSYATIQRREQHAAAAAVQYEPPPVEQQPAPKRKNVRSDGLSRRRLARRTRIDYLSQELIKAGKQDVTPRAARRGKLDASYYNAWDATSKGKLRKNVERHRGDFIPDLDHATSTSVFNVLARYVRFLESREENPLEADWVAAFEMSREEKDLLRRKRYIMEDVKAWAAIVMEQDSYTAAQALQKRVSIHGMASVPLAVATYLLRRPYISARALRVLIQHTWARFMHVERDTGRPPDPNSRFVVINRLLRHAREVWPQALEAIIEHMIRFTPDIANHNAKDTVKLVQIITYQMNKAMQLVSLATAVTPYKDVHYQEAPIVRILSYMANHSPALQLNRDGYRAVVRIQLAEKKTESEQKWAKLKGLSWPPWKEDRTAMDADVGPEHGISKAGETLNRMQEAGYQPEAWEQLAQIYSGWDVDGTPTIQTRVLMSANVKDKSLEAAVWAARIRTTRTAQEAWACYLAFEDTRLPTDDRVLMAIFRVLHQEERRQRAAKEKVPYPKQDVDQSHGPLHPGDVREVQPLPPSSHQHTYTRSPPPSVYEFYLQLKQRDAELGDSCLAFLIANAKSFDIGIDYLRAVHHKHVLDRPSRPQEMESDQMQVPAVLFDAYIEFLSRHPSVNLTKYRDIAPELAKMFGFGLHRKEGVKFNWFHSLGQAIDLLRAQRPRSLRAWNAVLTALSNGTANHRIHSALYDVVARDTIQEGVDLDRNAIVVHRLFKHVQDLYRKQNMDLDPLGFLAYCRAVESVTIASWRIAQRGDDSRVLNIGPFARLGEATAAELLALGVGLEDRPYRRAVYHFRLLVGQEPLKKRLNAPALEVSDGPNLPALLHAPGPAILHAYIRALGWCAAYRSLLGTLRWMTEHRAQLDEARERDRNGEAVMRRAVIAVRVFMERAWMNSSGARRFGSKNESVERDEEPGSDVLRRLESPASAAQIQEARALLEDWGGWATDEEVSRYCRDARFNTVRYVK